MDQAEPISKPLAQTLAQGTSLGCMVAFGGVWIVGWSLVTLLFDVLFAYSICRQMWACTYSSTLGKVTVSQIEQGEDSDGDSTYSPHIGYSYQVDGQPYESQLRRYFEVSTNGRKEVERVVANHPVGKEVTVYYNSANPSDAVLVRGLEGMDLLIGLFLLPFNVIMIGGWAFARAHFRTAASATPPPGVRCSDDGLRATLLIYMVRPWLAAAAAAGGTGMVMTFLAAFGQAIAPLLPLALFGWTCVLLIASCAYYLARRFVTRLEIDPLGGRWELQHSSQPPRQLATSDVESIATEQWDPLESTCRHASLSIL